MRAAMLFADETICVTSMQITALHPFTFVALPAILGGFF